MATGIPRYAFGERLAEILGESRRDLRFRVTLLVTSGLIAPGPRGRGSPPATPEYAALLLLGAMAAPRQADTLEAIRCYQQLRPTVRSSEAAPRVIVGASAPAGSVATDDAALLPDASMPFGDALARLIEHAGSGFTRDAVARELHGVLVSRHYPVSAVQFSAWQDGRRTIVSQRYELPEGVAPPSWLDPRRGGSADPGLLHTVFLPVRKLLEIGLATTPSAARSTPMLKQLGPKMAALADLIKRRGNNPNRQRWEKLLAMLATVQSWSDKVDSENNALVEVTGFGSNPGNLRMLTYVPPGLPAGAPLVVLLHGCTQSSASFDRGSGWSTLADRHGFALLLPQQSFKNNPLRCFNWFRPEDTTRGSGEPCSIREMIGRMIADHAIDPRRVFVTGLSSGGAMTAVMLATYPEVFAGGAVQAGVPYGAATGLQDAFAAMFEGRDLEPRQWGELVRAASPHAGPWPRVSIWHGDADTSVKPANAEALARQWTDVHGIGLDAVRESRVAGHRRRSWHRADGEVCVESYTIAGMAHGAALATGVGDDRCGTAAPFFSDVGLSSTYHIARFWGLVGEPATRAQATATAAPRAAAGGSAPAGADASSAPQDSDRVEHIPPRPERPRARGTGGAPGRRHGAGTDEGAQAGAAGTGARFGTPLGLDVHGIIKASLAAAGLRRADAEPQARSHAPLGIDVPGIISTALDAARVLAEKRGAAAGTGADARNLAGAGWHGEGWEFLGRDPRAFHGGPSLVGSATAGGDGGVGSKVRSISRQLALGPRPALSYVRRLHLAADVNDCTRAAFRVLVDGVVVDEVIAAGMTHVEQQWLRRSGLDLAAFAGRTVTLTLEVSAYANVCSEVSARASVADVVVQDAIEPVVI
jgi:poly(hydroxyalkanoate) depolymerase family esterase